MNRRKEHESELLVQDLENEHYELTVEVSVKARHISTLQKQIEYTRHRLEIIEAHLERLENGQELS